MKRVTAILLFGASTLLAGCANMNPFAGSNQRAREDAAAAAAVQPTEGAHLSALQDAALPKGACGMILWTLDEDRPAPIFRYLSGKTAQIILNGAPVALQRVDADGASAFGVFEAQQFVSETGVRVAVEVRFSLGFDGGNYLERGLISVETADGWRTVAPSAGLAGCRSA